MRIEVKLDLFFGNSDAINRINEIIVVLKINEN